jgi:hypothetical protein
MSRFDVSDELKENPTRIRVSHTFSGIIERSEGTRSVTPGTGKNYFEFCELVKTALDDYQTRLESPNKLIMSWEDPDKLAETEVVSISLIKREPGAFDQGAPFQGSVKNLRPILRESKQDPTSPGYRKVVLGKWYDNLVQFTCWAQTNKEAITRSFWFEQFIEKYTWFFTASGVQRVIFWRQEEDKLIDNDGKKLYGRPLLFYVKTEELTEYSEKEIEEIYVNLCVQK